jgi:adenylate cyclase class 2
VKNIEVEKKFAIPEPDKLKAILADRGSSPAPKTRQVDEYFNAPHKDFLAPERITEWVRIRTGDTTSSINYKCWHLDDPAAVHADEYETAVDDPTVMRLILTALGFTSMITVDKTREAWRLPTVEIVFDNVAGLGDFVEFEFKGDAESPADATDQLDALIASFGIELGAQINRGYPHMMLGRDS